MQGGFMRGGSMRDGVGRAYGHPSKVLPKLPKSVAFDKRLHFWTLSNTFPGVPKRSVTLEFKCCLISDA
ncbi:hypothetical protein H5410_001138 [Solanum commersonii]|uniref:Uncharacterized protein n=1 Tax=Solanum commersonii TaxID=4109 RepID=A0A9J6AXU1_SOLCO|nr:hypothetical protein H5410_001138 [Solanum commersonii]